jgi:NADPH:quinone reductase-like Zn-dependent oxidoreductase
MKAVVQDRYGTPDDLVLRDVPDPVAGSGQVRVRVRASSVHADVWHMITGRPYVLRLMGGGVRRPKNPIPGTDVAGVVEALGEGVTRFAVGDRVYGEVVRGFQWQNGGAFAELLAIDAEALWPMPERVSFEEAASVPTAGVIAMTNLIGGGREPLRGGQTAVINGAGGHLGTVVLQICKAWGAEVVAVDHTDKLASLDALGADRIVDYTSTDVVAHLRERDERVDLIFDVASTIAFPRCRAALRPGSGVYVRIGHDHYGAIGRRWLGAIPSFLGLLVLSIFYDGLAPLGAATDRTAVMDQLTEMLASGKLAPRIERTFPLAEVPDALRYLQSGQARGKIAIVP